MERRGISPLIATVLLVGLVITISIVVFTWSSGLLEGQQEDLSEEFIMRLFKAIHQESINHQERVIND